MGHKWISHSTCEGETYRETDLAVGYQYNVASEKVEGYVVVPATVSGKIDKSDVNVEVLYYKDSNGNNQPGRLPLGCSDLFSAAYDTCGRVALAALATRTSANRRPFEKWVRCFDP